MKIRGVKWQSTRPDTVKDILLLGKIKKEKKRKRRPKPKSS